MRLASMITSRNPETGNQLIRSEHATGSETGVTIICRSYCTLDAFCFVSTFSLHLNTRYGNDLSRGIETMAKRAIRLVGSRPDGHSMCSKCPEAAMVLRSHAKFTIDLGPYVLQVAPAAMCAIS